MPATRVEICEARARPPEVPGILSRTRDEKWGTSQSVARHQKPGTETNRGRMTVMRQKQSVLRRLALTAALLVAALAPAVGVHAQDTQEPAAAPAPTPVPEPTPIPVAEIPERAAAIGKTLRDAASQTDFSDELKTIGDEFEKEKEHISELEEETGRRLEIGGPASVIEEIEKAWVRAGARLDGWLKTLSSGVASI
jgi:hypothetical protein